MSFRLKVASGYRTIPEETNLVWASLVKVDRTRQAIYDLETLAKSRIETVPLLNQLVDLLDVLYELPYVADSALGVEKMVSYLSTITDWLTVQEQHEREDREEKEKEEEEKKKERERIISDITEECSIKYLDDAPDDDDDEPLELEETKGMSADERENKRVMQTERSKDLRADVKAWIESSVMERKNKRSAFTELDMELRKWYCSTLAEPVHSGMNRYKWKKTLYSDGHREEDRLNDAIPNDHEDLPLERSGSDCDLIEDAKQNLDCKKMVIALWARYFPWKLSAYVRSNRSTSIGQTVKEIASVCTWFPSCAFNMDVLNYSAYGGEKSFIATMKLLADKGITLDRITDEHMHQTVDELKRIEDRTFHVYGLVIRAQLELKTEIGSNLLLFKILMWRIKKTDILFDLLEIISNFMFMIG